MRKIIVQTEKKMKLSEYIKETFPNVPSSALFKALRNKDIKVNGVRVKEDTLVSKSDTIEIYLVDAILFNLPKEIEYVYEDDNILVAFKPVYILSNDEQNTANEPTFEHLVRTDKKQDNLFICHRLDRNTSGLILFAKSEKILQDMIVQFRVQNIHKEYIAYVANSHFSQDHEILEHYLKKDAKNGYAKILEYQEQGSEQVTTEYTVLEKNNKMNYAKLNVVLHTGKTHQVRAHLAYIGHPIIGDSKYGKNEINKMFKKNVQQLFAYRYTFTIDNPSLSYLNAITIMKNIPNVF